VFLPPKGAERGGLAPYLPPSLERGSQIPPPTHHSLPHKGRRGGLRRPGGTGRPTGRAMVKFASVDGARIALATPRPQQRSRKKNSIKNGGEKFLVIYFTWRHILKLLKILHHFTVSGGDPGKDYNVSLQKVGPQWVLTASLLNSSWLLGSRF